MKLTHHSTPSRSFIILIIIVLCTVYAALVLTRINKLYVQDEIDKTISQEQTPTKESVPEPEFPQVQPADTARWNEFVDQDYPLTFLRPQGWNVTWNDDIDDLYIVYVTRNDPRAQIKIYLTKTEPAEPRAFGKMTFVTANGYEATNYYNNIYQIKYGEYYYVFDGSAAQNYRAELAGIVNTADLSSE